ncbi:MAG: tetratricopeptide repeat protein [Flavobacteriaceae bacterium]
MKKIILLVVLIHTFSLESQNQETFESIDSLILRGRYKVALTKLNSFEDSFRKQNTIASIYYQLDKTKEAVKYYRKALDIKDDYKAKVQLGKSYQKLRIHSKTIDIYESILKTDPQNLLIKYQLGKLYLTKRRANVAIKTFEELCGIDKTNPNYAYQKGVAYAMKKDRNAMIDSFLEAYAIDSTHIKSIYQLANSYYKLKDKDSTSLFLEKGLQLEPYHINLNRLKVNETYRHKKYKVTLQLLEKLDTLTPGQLFVINMFGRTHYNLGNYEESKEYFDTSKSMDRTDFKILTYLGHIEMKLENYQRAMMNYSFATFLGKEKRDEEYYGMGHAHLKLKQPKRAIAMFDKAYKENRSNHKALYQLAKTSDDYFKDKKLVYKHYDQYVMQFEFMDKDLAAYAKRRMKEIKKDYFLRGEKIGD